jgi:DNA-binding transcriptional LysR family regulator
MDRFREMEIFTRVIETGAFSGAARQLKIGQPAVSKAVVALEERLGVRLLARSTRRLAPTEAGMAYYERALRALTEANEADASAQGLSRGLEGQLRICAPVTFARLHLVPRLATFLDAHPKLRMEIILDDRVIDVLEENIDVALRLGELKDSALTASKLSESDRIIVASSTYLAQRGVPYTPADLLAHDGIVYAPGTGGDEWRFRQGTSETSIRIQSRLVITAAEGIRAAVIAGLGLTAASRWMFAPELASGLVRQVLSDWMLPPVPVWYVYPAGRLASAKAREFVKWFQRVLA